MATEGYPNKRARTQRTLLRGAMEVMATGGSEAMTAAAVCRAAGVSNGTLYNYFDGVDDLVQAVADDLATLFQLGAESLERLSGDPAARVGLGILRLLALPSTDPVYAEAFLAVMASQPTFRAHVREIVRGEVHKGVDLGVFHTPSEAAVTDALLGALLQTIRSMLLGEVRDEESAVVEVCLRLLGVRADETADVVGRAVGTAAVSAA